MPGYTEKSRRYLRLAVENDKRAAAAMDPRLKASFVQIAAQYRRLAEQIDDPKGWLAKKVACAKASGK
jgi:hypothetical protein